jgi:Flp pilus assembly protein TadG
MTHHRLGRRQRGSAMIEFAVVGPLLTLIGTLMLQFVSMYNAKNLVNHASFMAARAGSMANASMTSVCVRLSHLDMGRSQIA